MLKVTADMTGIPNQFLKNSRFVCYYLNFKSFILLLNLVSNKFHILVELEVITL